ncbi:ATPase [Methanomicrobiaceae archaeon CYW5]|uniref:ATPase n=1 Tax=Methanovulcanius yangii TaxID=1789227 RepID=UPI0029CA9EAE|nr:ATPase [Methanovulcanius yangii]MBT8508282.1 ATPase [Methanovulcanius yangii]
MKTEVLKSIKQTEEERRTMIAAAYDAKAKMIADARVEAENMVAKETEGAKEYKAKRIADAEAIAAQKSAETREEGKRQAEAVRAASNKNLDKAVALLVDQFKVKLNV